MKIDINYSEPQQKENKKKMKVNVMISETMISL